MVLRRLCVLLTAIFAAGNVMAQVGASVQKIETPEITEQLVFSLKDKTLLSAKGDSLMLIATLPDHKEIWIYRASDDNILKSKAEIFYSLPSFAFSSTGMAFYDLGMNRFVFTKANNGKFEDFLGDKLKDVIEPSLSVSLPRFYPLKNSWLALTMSAYANMDSKLMYGVLNDEGKWEVQPRSIFDYPEGMTQNFGLVRSFAYASFSNRSLVCCQISGNHYLSQTYQQPKGMLMLTEFDGAFNKMRQVAVSDAADGDVMGKDVPTWLGLASMGDRLALVVKCDATLYAKLLDANYKPIGTTSILGESTDAIKSCCCLPIGGKGFVVIYSTASGINLAYVTRNGELTKHWQLYDSSMTDMTFYCMSSADKLHVLVKDNQRSQLVRKSINVAELEK